jgi:hypothetical protein
MKSQANIPPPLCVLLACLIQWSSNMG